MTKEKSSEEFNPWQSYLMIGAGVCLIATSFLRGVDDWSTIDFLKIGLGTGMIGYGAYRLIKRK